MPVDPKLAQAVTSHPNFGLAPTYVKKIHWNDLYYFLEMDNGVVHLVRRKLYAASDTPLNSYEEVMVAMCNTFVGAQSGSGFDRSKMDQTGTVETHPSGGD